jgi:hypothetical protein
MADIYMRMLWDFESEMNVAFRKLTLFLSVVRLTAK